MILFLDFDGVLHPDAVYLVQGRPELRADGKLFMWAEVLGTELAGHPEVQIVLSTSWVRHLGFQRARSHLPVPLRERVIGSTWHSQMGRHPEGGHRVYPSWWDTVPRYDQIQRWADRASAQNWIAIDDDGDEWPEADRGRLILTRSDTGLSDPVAIARLSELLEDK